MDLDNLNGVGKKIISHCAVFSADFQVYLIAYGDKTIQTIDISQNSRRTREIRPSNRRSELNREVLQFIRRNDVHGIYMRYHLSDPGFLKLLSAIQRHHRTKIAIEIPTFPYKGEFTSSLRDRVRKISDSICSTQLKRYVDRIVTYSDDRSIFGIPTIKTINGVLVDKIRPISRDRLDGDIDLVSVSVTASVHGYDRIIEGIRLYYQKGGKENIIYHLVGNGHEIACYKRLVEDYHLKEHVLIYGFKNGRELDEIYNKADIAVNSLGIHRRGLRTESTLKTKEYAAKGLPMISSYTVDVFDSGENRKYVYLVPADDSPVNMQDVVDFYHQVYAADVENVFRSIREIAVKKCDMRITQKPVVDFFKNGQ